MLFALFYYVPDAALSTALYAAVILIIVAGALTGRDVAPVIVCRRQGRDTS